jgi:hypothetical protein
MVESVMDDPTYFKVTVNSWDFTSPQGSIDLDIEVMEPVPDISSMYLRMAINEDNATYGPHAHDDVTRDMLDDIPITVDGLGEIQNVNEIFDIDPSWVESELDIIAFIQDDTDKSVLGSAITEPNPDYSLRYYTLGHRIAVGPAGWEPYQFDFFHLYNVGNLTDDYTISVELDAPDGWTAILCEEGVCWGPIVYETLTPGAELALLVEIEAPTSGYGVATVTLSQSNQPAGMERTFKYTYLTNDLEVLVVDDDGIDEYEQYLTDALEYFGYSYGVWDHNLRAPSTGTLFNFPIVVWSVGDAFPTLEESDRTALAGYLNAGKNLFITGQDIGWEMHDLGGDAYQWYQDYLHATFITDDSHDNTLEGVPGDIVTGGLDLVIEGGDGADNQVAPDDIDPADGSATVIWTYDEDKNGGLRADTGTHKVVYLAFGYEAIDSAHDRRIVLRRIIRWFNGVGGACEAEPVFRAALSITPNPVQASSLVRFTLPEAGQADLQIFGPDGRLIRTLAGGALAAGNHVIEWDRSDARGARVPAGVYYYKLAAQGANLARKAVLLK